MAYKNNFKFAFTARLNSITYDDYVNLGSGDGEILKVTAIFEAVGDEMDGDMLEVNAWGEKGEFMHDLNDGDLVDLKCNIRTRFVEGRNGLFSSTECTAYFVKRHEVAQREERKRRADNDSGPDGTERRNARTERTPREDGKKPNDGRDSRNGDRQVSKGTRPERHSRR